MKHTNITCPYCHSKAHLRPACVVYGQRVRDPDSMVYVCDKFPLCDSYVGAHKQTLLPMGTLANRDLRHQRVLAHDAITNLCRCGNMTQKSAYRWLQAKLDLPESDMHIGRFSEFRCAQIISICNQFCLHARRKVS